MAVFLTRKEFKQVHALAAHPETDEAHYKKFMQELFDHDKACRTLLKRAYHEIDDLDNRDPELLEDMAKALGVSR